LAEARRANEAMLKRLFFLTFMMSMVGAPYVFSSSSEWWNSLTSKFSSSAKSDKAPAAGGSLAPARGAGYLATIEQGHAAQAEATSRNRNLEGAPARSLEEILQFEGTPAWVMARWPRVTAGLAELDLQGYRVPLVSGTGPDDLAGSLTYYFNKDQKIERIIFHGTTGDPRKLITLVTSKYSFLHEPTSDPSLSLFQAKWHGKPHSELRIRPARVVRADQPHVRYEVDLAMKRP
jgi:hypothetical protein